MSIDLRPFTVAQYKMNDTSGTTVVDFQGFSNGTSQRDTSLMVTAGKIGGALSFNGTSDYVDTGNSFASVFNAPFTISMWVNLNDGQPPVENAIFGNIDGSGLGFEIWNYGPYGEGYLPFYWQTGTGLSVSYSGTHNLLPDGPTGWFHIVVMIYTDAGKVKGRLYFNNSLIVTRTGFTGDMSAYAVTGNILIGAGNQPPVYPTDGLIDNVCIFNKALSTDEIAFLYNSGNGTEELTDIVESEGIFDYE